MIELLPAFGIQPYHLSAVYVTHGHSDHYEGAALLRKESDVEVHAGQADRAGMATGDYWRAAGFFTANFRYRLPKPWLLAMVMSGGTKAAAA